MVFDFNFFYILLHNTYCLLLIYNILIISNIDYNNNTNILLF